MLYYVQDSRYVTHVIECTHIWEDNNAICHEEAKYAHNTAIATFTTAFFKNYEGFQYFYLFVFKEDLKTIRIVNYTGHSFLMNITYQGRQ